MKTLQGVLFNNGQMVSVDKAKGCLVINDQVKIPCEELNAFVKFLRQVKRKGSTQRLPDRVRQNNVLTWGKAVPQPFPFKLHSLLARVTEAAHAFLSNRPMTRQVLTENIAQQIAEPPRRISPILSKLIHKYGYIKPENA